MSEETDDELTATSDNVQAKFGLAQEQFAHRASVTWSDRESWENSRGNLRPRQGENNVASEGNSPTISQPQSRRRTGQWLAAFNGEEGAI